MTRCYIALGSNLDNPLEQLQRAVAALDDLPDSELGARSGIYRSRPLGPRDQPQYLNAVVALDTGLAPLPLLEALQTIEQQQGRERSVLWGPRTLDLDLLLYGDLSMQSARLTLPHPRMHERDFVLIPLREIVSGKLMLPNGADLDTLLSACPDNNLAKTEHLLSAHRAGANEK